MGTVHEINFRGYGLPTDEVSALTSNLHELQQLSGRSNVDNRLASGLLVPVLL